MKETQFLDTWNLKSVKDISRTLISGEGKYQIL